MVVSKVDEGGIEHTPSTESALLDRFELTLRSGIDVRRSPNQILLHELEGLQGRADLVDAHINALPDAVSLDALAVSLTSPAKARLLALLRYGAPRSRSYLERGTGFSHRSLGDHVRKLEREGLVTVHRNSSISLGCPLPWSMVEIAAYECKLSNWRRALHQAIGYRSFSQSSWVVMPASGAQHAKKLAAAFQINGIGLIAIASDGSTHVEIRSRKRRPASRRIYLMAVGTILKKYVEERRRLHRRLRPESIQGI